MPFIGNAGQASNIYEKNYATTTLRIVEGDAAYQSYNPADSHYKLITNLESITAVGSTSSNTMYLTNAHIGYTTVANVGIMNTSPIHTLDVGANVCIDEFGSNVVYVKGNIFSENIQTTDIIADQEISCRDLTAFNVVRSDDTVTNQIFPRTTNFLHITSNTGVLNSAPQHTLSVSDKLIIDKDGSNIVYVHGNTYSDHLKAPIATIENVFTNNVYAKSDNIVHIGSNVGIMNSNPIHTLDVGSNVQIDDVGSNTFWTGGNVYAQRYSGTEITLTGTIVASDFILSGGSQSTPTPQLQTVSEVNPQIGQIQFSSDKTLTLTNVTKGLNVASNITTMTLYGNVVSENVYSTGNITVGTNNLFVDTTVGRVGINKSSPVKELDVTGEIAGSGDLAIGTNKLFVDVSEGHVGINKSSPVKELDVTGEIACSSNLAVNTDKLFVDANAGRVGINKSSPTEALDVVGKISGTDDLVIGANKLFVDVSEGRVGINKSSPTEALDVVGKISGTDDLAIGTNKLFVDVSEGRVGINKSSPTKALDVTGEIAGSDDLTIGTNKLFVDVSTGRVGINKSSPTKALDVTGEIACSSDFAVATNKLFVNTSTGRIGINRNDPGKNLDIAGDFRCSSDLQVGSVANLFVDVSESCVGINKSTPSRALDVVGKIAGTDDLEIGTDKLFVDVSESRVGINKSAPTKALDVTGEIQASSHATIGGNLTVNTDDLVVDTVNSRVGINKSVPSKALDVVGEIQASSHATIGGNLTVNTDDLVVDTVNSRVGINKSAPSKALDVIGEIQASSHATIGGNLTVNTDDLVVDTVNSRVGINNASPNKALDVTGEIQASSHATIGGNLTVNTDDLVVDTVNSRVGINKSAPSKALDVTGEIACSGHLTVGGDLVVNGTTTTVNTTTLSVKDTLIELGKDNTTGTSDLGLVMTRPGSNVAVFYNEGDDKLQIGHTLNGAGDSDITLDSGTRLPVNIQGDLEVGTANLFVNTATGNVGVGTNSPRSELDINGTGALILPSGTTAQRNQTPVNGMLRYNSDTGYVETYTVSGWGAISTPPSITSFTPTSVYTNVSSGTQITVTGSFFDQNSSIRLRGSNGTEYATTSFSFTSTTTIGATLPYLPNTNSPYKIVATSGSGLSVESTDTFTANNNIPVWSSPAEGSTITLGFGSTTITLSATDPDGDTLTYSVVSGTLPSGLTLSGNQISGTWSDSSDSTSTITVRASDGDVYADRRFIIETPLYAFTSHTFTNAGQTGRTGPTLTQLRNAYTPSWTDDTDNLNMRIQGYQIWTVPSSGTYQFIVAGAGNTTYGGRGVICTFNYDLIRNTKLTIVVGQMGSTYSSLGGGGSGCSTVYNDDMYVPGADIFDEISVSKILSIGGGSSPYRDASTSTSGVDGLMSAHYTTYNYGGTDGRGGGGGGAGAGFLGYGINNPTNAANFTGGFTGGHSSYYHSSLGSVDIYGGFGGGGAGTAQYLNTIGARIVSGGGGGYSGGGGGAAISNYSGSSNDGGGGGSYIKSDAGSKSYSYNSSGHGYVTITKL